MRWRMANFLQPETRNLINEEKIKIQQQYNNEVFGGFRIYPPDKTVFVSALEIFETRGDCHLQILHCAIDSRYTVSNICLMTLARFH